MSFQFTANLGGLEAPTVSTGFTPAPEGYYTVDIDAVNKKEIPLKDGGAFYKAEFVCSINDGEYKGSRVWVEITIPDRPDSKAFGYWRGAYESIGYTAAQLDGAGQITISGDQFVNQKGHVYYRPGNKEAGRYSYAQFLAPAVWAAQKAEFEAVNAAAGTGTGLNAAAGLGAPEVGGLGGLGAPAGGLGAPSNGLGAPAGGTQAQTGAANADVAAKLQALLAGGNG